MSVDAGDSPNLTEQQRRPLGIVGASVALSAGAGCGKTTVLTSRFLTALEGGGVGSNSGVRSLVALTFTEKAARELRKRIRDECHKRLARASNDDVSHWRSVLRGLETAPIGTFHEYCAALLRRHALEAGIDPDFQIFDAAIADSIRDEALTRCLRGWLASSHADLIELAVTHGLRSVRESLGTLIESRGHGDLAAWATRSEDEVVEAWRAFWDREGKPALIRRFLDGARACESLLVENPCRHPKMAERRVILLDAFRDLESARDPVAVLASIDANARVQGGGKADDWPSAEVYEKVKDRLTKVRESAKKLVECLEIDLKATERSAADGLRFARLAQTARQAYDDAKRGRDGLDFDDLLVKTRDLLQANPETIGRDVSFVLVDEFQDTDPVQAEILRSLGGDAFASGRLFVVGDYKQSIYRFRGAQPQLFQEFRAEFPEAGRHDLTENYRSTTGILAFVNALFAGAFPGEHPPLEPGPGSSPASDGPAVEFVWAEEPADDEDIKATGANAARKTEARWLARLIRSRIEAGWMVRDRETKTHRKATPGDVAFLFRAMTDLAPYEAALQAEGLDFHVVGGKAFYAQQEVQDLVNVLSVIEDPLDPVALAGVLRGPFFGLSDEALFRLGGSASFDLAEGLERHDGLDELDHRRASRAKRLLAHWRGLKDRVSMAELVDRVLDESGFEAALLGEFLGDRKRANARKLVRLARRFDARGGFTLGHFVARIRQDLREPPREEQASTTDEEGKSVRLMSIHQAKGLEFPIVVVPDLNRKQELPRKGVAFHPELGPLVRPVAVEEDRGQGDDDEGSGRSLGWLAFETVERREEEAESIRLFYVATTRARDALILSAGAGPEANPLSAALKWLDERFDRRTGTCRTEGAPANLVRVTTEAPGRSASTGPRPRRVRLEEVARVIDSTPQGRATPRVDGRLKVVSRPRFFDLETARGLSPRADRLDRLVRSILGDPRAVSTGKLADVARLAARRQDFPAHPDLVDEAIALLEPWLGGAFGNDLARAPSIERGTVWTVAWGGTVFQGRTEFFLGGANGSSRAVIVGLTGAAEPVERLRLLLSSRAARGVVEGWRIRLGDGLHGEEDFSDAAIGEALRAVESNPIP